MEAIGNGWMQHSRKLLTYRNGGDFPSQDTTVLIGVIVGIAGLLLLILVCAAACCGCMIPSEECFQRLGGCIVLTRARCWCDCCGWRRKNGNDWVDPELPAPQHCEKHGKASPSKHHPKKMESIQEESPKGWGGMSREDKEALTCVILTSSDCSDPIPADTGLRPR